MTVPAFVNSVIRREMPASYDAGIRKGRPDPPSLTNDE
jgi:hypothetical protein